MKYLGILVRKGNLITYVPTKIIDLAYKYNYKPLLLMDFSCKEMLEKCEKIILPGGDEVIYEDLKFIDYCFKNDIPILGICLGMQEMGVYLKGKLDNFKTSFHKQKLKYVHDIEIKKNSKLFEILKTDTIKVNSRHISYLKIADKYVSSYYKNTPESIEVKTKKFFIGLQWHPEDMIEYDIVESRLLDYFFKLE